MIARIEREPRKLFIAGLVCAFAALLVFGWLAEHVAAGRTIAFDAAVRNAVHAHASPALTEVMRVFTAFGAPVSLLVLGIGALAALYAAGWRRAALLFLITMCGAFVLDAGLKFTFHRTRPVSFFGTPLPASYSFPSGHALFSVCFFGALAETVATRTRNRAAQAALWIAAAFLALAIGLSRIYLGVHYPSDVLGGYMAAVVWVGTVAAGDRIVRRRRKRAGKPVERVGA